MKVKYSSETTCSPILGFRGCKMAPTPITELRNMRSQNSIDVFKLLLIVLEQWRRQLFDEGVHRVGRPKLGGALITLQGRI